MPNTEEEARVLEQVTLISQLLEGKPKAVIHDHTVKDGTATLNYSLPLPPVGTPEFREFERLRSHSEPLPPSLDGTIWEITLQTLKNARRAAKLGLIGHDYVLIEKLAKRIWRALPNGTMVTKVRETLDRRGFTFEVQITDGKNRPTGHIARVQITLDRMEATPDE